MNLTELQTHLREWLSERGLSYHTIDKWIQLGIVMEEVGETASVLTKGKGHIDEEIADIIISATCLAIALDVNIEKAIHKKLKILEGRTPHRVNGHIRITHD